MPRVRCALAGLVLTVAVAVAADSVSAALWSLTYAGWLPVLGVAQPGPQGARRTAGGASPMLAGRAEKDRGGHALSPWPLPGKIPVKAVPVVAPAVLTWAKTA